jgi:DNA replication regulator SLD3
MPPSPRRAPLTAPTTSQLNVQMTKQLAGSKRKSPSSDSYDVRTILVHAASPVQKPDTATFAPIAVLQRSHLPLSWLSPAGALSVPPSGYVFKSGDTYWVTALNAIHIARALPNGGLHAIELVAAATFTAWPLSNYVTEAMCHDAAQGTATQLPVEQLINVTRAHSRTASLNSDSAFTLPTPQSPRKAKNRRGAAARVTILTANNASESQSAVVESPTVATTLNEGEPGSEVATSGLTSPDVTGLPTPGADDNALVHMPVPVEAVNESPLLNQPPQSDRSEALTPESLIQQYLETLYLSRTSLAFYSKGPLSRARAQARDPKAALEFEALRGYYLGMILQAKKLDLKYKESISSLIRSLPSQGPQQEVEQKGKKRAAKKNKLGKTGLYTTEDDFVSRWWRSREVRTPLATTSGDIDADLRKSITDLRNRETSMQLLLILEVLNLDQVIAKAADANSLFAEPRVKVEDAGTEIVDKAKKPERKRDLATELDAAAEKLSIWHTVALEDILSSPEKVREDSADPNGRPKDKLRDFCRDVIIPFYGAKLPEQTKSVCRKLGGPGLTPQRSRPVAPKPKIEKETDTSSKGKPRPTKRPLERVLSEDRTVRKGSPPVLSRSATAPLVSKLKRTSSDVEARPVSRSGMEKSVSFSNREIDLIADAKTHETKRRKLDKLSSQKKELEEAIDALKKPNRTGAARTFMDEIERRKSESKKPERAGLVTSTPRRGQTKRVKAEAMTEKQNQPTEKSEIDGFVPASTMKPHITLEPTVPMSTKKKRAVLNAVNDTPSHRLSKHSEPFSSAVIAATPAPKRSLDEGLPLDTPLPARLTSINMRRQVLFTPVKRNDLNPSETVMFKDVLEIPERAGKAMDRVMGGIRPGEMFDDLEQLSQGTPRGLPSKSSLRPSPAPRTAAVGTSSGAASESHRDASLYDQLGWNDYDDI